jgi:hypothetical protein
MQRTAAPNEDSPKAQTAAAHWVSDPRDLFTVQQFAERRPAWSPPALRSLILNAKDRLSSRGERIGGNGLAEAGAIVRVGRRVLIDEEAFFRWIAVQQKKVRS